MKVSKIAFVLGHYGRNAILGNVKSLLLGFNVNFPKNHWIKTGYS